MTRRLDRRFVWGIRIIAVLMVGGTFLRVVSSAVSPDGYLTVRTDIGKPSPFVSYPKPATRLDLEGGAPYRVIGDPIYFDLTPPSKFETVTVTARYLNRNQQTVEIGALANRLDGQYDMRPAENRLIDSLSWNRLTSGNLTLLQRWSAYRTIDEFLANPPDASKVATYRTGTRWPYRPSAYAPIDGTKTRDVSLRGHHRMLTYTGGEPLSFNFSVQDMNRQEGADPVTVSVYLEGEKNAAARTVLEDDGNTADDQKSSGLRSVSVTLTAPQAGLYRVEFTASDDVFIRRLTTRQGKFVFLNRLYVGDYVGYSDFVPPAKIYVGGRSVVVRTAHEEGLQKIVVGTQEVDIREPHVRYVSWLRGGTGPQTVETQKRDLLFETEGAFALDADDFFDPLPTELAWYMTAEDLAASGIDFVLTEYEPPTMSGNLTVAKTTFDVGRLATTEDGAYRFALSAPGVDLTGNDLRLESMTFVLRREPTGWARGLSALLSSLGRPQTDDRETAIILSDGRSYGERVE